MSLLTLAVFLGVSLSASLMWARHISQMKNKQLALAKGRVRR